MGVHMSKNPPAVAWQPLPKCETVGCQERATRHMDYVYRGFELSDDVCKECFDGYSRRPSVRITSVVTL